MLAVGAGRLTSTGGRFFGAPPLAIGGGPEPDAFVGMIGAVDMSGTGTLDGVSVGVWSVESGGGS